MIMRISYSIALLLIISVQTVISREEGGWCLGGESIPEEKYVYHNGTSQKVTLLVNHKLETRLVGTIFKLLAKEKLGYEVSLVGGEADPSNSDLDASFRKLSICKNEFCEDLDSRLDSHRSRLPQAMVALDLMMAPTSYVDKWGLLDVGQLGPATRLGWFLPMRTRQSSPPYQDHWEVFRDPDSLTPFLFTEEQEDFIRQKVKREDGSFYCEEYFCQGGFYSPPQCEGQRCAVLLAEYPEFSRSQNKSAVVQLIQGYGLYVRVAFLGSNLESSLLFMDRSSLEAGTSYIVLHYSPSLLTSKYNLSLVLFPTCDDPLILRADNQPECMFAPGRMAKVVWKPLQNKAPDLYNFIENFNFDLGEYMRLLGMFNDLTDSDSLLDQVACEWLNHDVVIHGVDNLSQTEHKQPWYQNFPITRKNHLYIGGIFPISGTKFTAPELGPVAIMAVSDINNNPNILPSHKLMLDIQDGQCEADIVMKKFIDFIKNKDPSRFRRTVGILGPACSNTVEPIAGVSKHYRTLVVSYSAEGSISNGNNQEFPYLFRTIAENKQYKHAYLAAMEKFEWRKVASLTQDGSKYSHYMSSLQDVLQESGIDFVINRKFPRDTKDMSLYLRDLKERGAKVIIADFYEPAARHIMCQAFKLKMTQAHGYVWFLPGWYKEGWYDLDNLDYDQSSSSDEGERLTALKQFPNCTTQEMLTALDGALSLVHNNYAPNTSKTVGNITVAEWKERLEEQLDTAMNVWSRVDQSKSFDFEDGNTASKYSGYVYDAVWLYALALDKLIKQDKAMIQDLHSEETIKEFVKIIKKLDFNGVSGRINFIEGNSRLSETRILQLHVTKEVLVGDTTIIPSKLEVRQIGLYVPEYPNISSSLKWFDEKIQWKTESGEKPTDEERSCGALTALSVLLNLECQLTITVAFLIAFALVLGGLMGLFVGLKMRYEKKMRLQEDRMRALGLLTPMTVLALDDWEMPRDRVVINRKLGEGAFGMVYGGEAFFDDRGWVAVAVKTLKTGSTVEEKVDFLSEADIMKRFEHKNIVKLLGVCTRNEPVYTVMEYMLYGDLKTYLLARRHLVTERNREELDEVSNKRLTSMAYDVANGLTFLHEQKYVHRDVACRNCLVNSSRTIKLADFGMTRQMFQSDYYRFSRRGMLPVRWMSPESLADGIFTPMSDIWSYGVLLYEIITFGSFPFQGLSNNQVLENVKNGQTLSQPSGIKSQLGSLLRSCWSPTPTKRPSASEVVELLYNNPRLISPCIDVPLASVQMERTDSLEMIPSIKKSPTHATIVGTVNSTGDAKAKSSGGDSRNGYYSPMSSNTDCNGYYKPDYKQESLDPLLPVGSYVQPGYIYVCDNYA